MPSPYLTDIQVAERFGVARETVWRWKREGRFPKAVKLGPGVTRWRIADIEDWEATCTIAYAVRLDDTLTVASAVRLAVT